jgi:hypothetical protein
VLKSFARKLAAKTLLAIAFLMDSTRIIVGLLGAASIVYGVHLVYRPAAWIVGGFFALREAESQLNPPKTDGSE